MPTTMHTCPVCGGLRPATEPFCAECGSRNQPVEVLTSLQRSQQTQFTLPDYLMTARAREAAERKHRLSVDEGAGTGFAWLGAFMAAGSAMLSPLVGAGAVIFGVGLLLVLFGFWRMRRDSHAFNLAGGGVGVVGAMLLGSVLAQTAALPVPVIGVAPTPETTAAQDPSEPAAKEVEVALGGVPMFGGNPARTGVQPGPAPAGAPVRAWRVYTGGEVYASPIVENGVVYLGVKGGDLLALDATTGEERWRVGLGGDIVRATPAFSGGTLFVPAGAVLHALDAATGRERWQMPIQFAGPSSPVASGHLVYVATQEGQLYAVDQDTGREAWHFATDGLVSCPPTVAAGTLFVGDDTGKVYALDAETGRERWRATVGGDIFAAPTVGLGRVFVSTSTPELVALDAETGHQRWQVPMGGESTPAFTGSTVLLGSQTHGVYALDAGTGRTRWIFPTGSPVGSSPVVSGGTVLVGSGDTLYALDAQTGAPRWGYPTGGALEGSAAVTGGFAYFGSRDGYLYAIRGSDGA